MRRPVLGELDRRILALAIPALGALVVEPVYNLTDTAIVGHLGRAPLGGLAVATSILNVAGWAAGFLSMATTSQVAYRHGRGDLDRAGQAAVAAYVVAVVLGLVLAGALAVAAPLLARLLGGHGHVLTAATTYLRISCVGLPFLLITLAGNGHLRGLADARTPFRITVVANLVNIVLEVALVYGLRLGIAGSAWGTATAQVSSAAMFAVAARRAFAGSARRPDRSEIAELLRAGVVLFVRTAALGSALIASTAVAARLGANVLGGHQVTLQIWLLLALTLDALAVPAQVYVSQALGGGNLAEACAVGARVLRLGFVTGASVGLLLCALSPALPAIFTASDAVRRTATVGLLVCGLLQPLAAAAFVLDGLLLGAGDYAGLRRAMLLALLAFVPLAAVTLRVHALGIAGVWLALTCWLAARAGLLGVRWRSGRWAHIRLSAVDA
jgi:putative MATE family efflux protein